MDSLLPDEILLKIFSYLDKRELCKCACVSRRWNALSYADELWHEFSLTVIKSPKWCASKLISIENTNYLISSRFSENITRVDLSKMCFSFDTLDTLFQHCRHIASLCINFKYLQIRQTLKFHVSQCAVDKWPQNKLESLYLKNVCDMKTRRYQSKVGMGTMAHTPTSYDLIEMEIIKLIRMLFRLNASSLRVLGLKCVDPNVISSCVNDFGNLHVLLLNNINDTDSVLQELAGICRHLKCLELNKCREFEGDGLQDVVDQCTHLETLQIGKHIYPTLTELNEINWTNFKHHLKELSITTKFQATDKYMSSSSSSSTCSSGSSSNSSNSPIDLYSSTIFNYLNASNHLEYLALADFTLRFPVEHNKFMAVKNGGGNMMTVAAAAANHHRRRKKLRVEDVDDDEEEEEEENDDVDEDDEELETSATNHNHILASNLKYLFLRNIRNIKTLTTGQIENLRSFLQVQFNLHTLDLIGLYIDSKFICSILDNLNNLRVVYFGHGKSYKKNLTSVKYLSKINSGGSSQSLDTYNYKYIDIDQINYKLAECCPMLTHFGIFYRQFELKFKKDPQIESKNDSLINLLVKCSQLKEISYLKSFKIQEDDCEEDEEEEEGNFSSSSNHQTDSDSDSDDDLDESDDEEVSDETKKRKKRKIKNETRTTTTTTTKRKCRSYFHFIKYAIENVNPRVNMKPCYGFDITPSSGHFLDFANREFIETSLPPIQPPHNDFHTHLLR